MFEEVRRIMLTKNRDDWVRLLMGRDTCLTPVLDLEEILEESFLFDRGVIKEVEDPRIGKTRTLGSIFDRSSRAEYPAPIAGEHTKELLTSAGYDQETIKELRRRGVV